MRFTYKLEEPISTKYFHYDYLIIADYDIGRGNFGRIADSEIYNKLGEYEDTEEELNVNLKLLPTLLKIKEGDKIYVIDGTLVEAEVTGNSLIDGELMVFSHYEHNGIIYTPVCYYSDYGKTWAFTREELEK